MTPSSPRVLGIDPGSYRTGFGIVEKRASQFVHIANGIIKNPPKSSLTQQIKRIYQDLVAVIHQFEPTIIAVEEIFYHKSIRTALKLGHVRGVAILAGVNHDLALFSYPPLEVKKSIVGYGRASKDQVQKMVSLLLGMSESIPEDAADALAVAICHLNRNVRLSAEKLYTRQVK